MENLRDLFMAAMPNKSIAMERRKVYNDKRWAIPYLGRRLNALCLDKYKDSNINGFKVVLPWENQECYKVHNGYDSSTYEHELVVSVYREGPAKGRIKDISAYHWDHWETTSNWQDHAESHSTNVKDPNLREIRAYEAILNDLTEGGVCERIDALVNQLKVIATETKGRLRIRYSGKDGELAIFVNEGDSNPPNNRSDVRINSNKVIGSSSIEIASVKVQDLLKVLEYSMLFPEVLFSSEEREEKCSNGWINTLQLEYFLSLFSNEVPLELYQDFDSYLAAWLFELFDSCRRVRIFYGIDDVAWWKDAWWRIQEILSRRNLQIVNSDTFNKLVYNGRNPDAGIRKIDNPLLSLAGTISLYTKPTKNRQLPDNYSCQSDKEKLGVMFSSKNGVKWAYYFSLDRESIIIELGASILEEGVRGDHIVIPTELDGKRIKAIEANGMGAPKDWKNVEYKSQIYNEINIGKCAFKGWTHLESVIINASAVEISESAFEGCEALRQVMIETLHCELGARAFKECNLLSKMEGIVGCKEIGAECFYGCVELKAITMQCCVIAESAFEKCTTLEEVFIEGDGFLKENVGSIGNCCFKGCVSLKSLLLSKGCRIVDDTAFEGCNALRWIFLCNDGLWYSGNINYDKVEIENLTRCVKYNEDEGKSLIQILNDRQISTREYAHYVASSKAKRKPISDEISDLATRVKCRKDGVRQIKFEYDAETKERIRRMRERAKRNRNY